MTTQAPLVTDELRAYIGKEKVGPPEVVELGMIREFAKAIAWPDPPDPLYTDEAFARKTRHRGIVAPPTFFTRLGHGSTLLADLPLPTCRTTVNGGQEYEPLAPIRPGDTITTKRNLVDVKERQGRHERMLFLIYEFTYTNQLNEVVGKGKFTQIRLH